MGASRSRRLRAAFAACGLVLAASAGRADQTGGGSLRGRGPGCPDHKACFEGFANRQHRLRTIVSGFRETRTVPGGTPVVTSGRFSWRAPGNPTWQVERGSSRSEGKPDAGAADLGPFADLARIFTSTDEYVGSRFDMVAGSGGPQTVRLVPRNKSATESIEVVDLEVDPSTGLVRSATVLERGGTQTRIELVEAEVDRPDPVR